MSYLNLICQVQWCKTFVHSSKWWKNCKGTLAFPHIPVKNCLPVQVLGRTWDAVQYVDKLV